MPLVGRVSDWRGIVINDLSGLSFFQYRTQISISRLINDTLNIYTPPRDPKKLVKLGENPVPAIIPLPGCSNDQLDRVIAQGLLAGVIIKGKRGYELIKPLTEPKYIGDSVDQIRDSLSKNYDDISFINEKFAREVAKKGSSLLSPISEYSGNSIGTGPLVVELGKVPFQMTREIAEALLPYLTRLPKQYRQQ